MRALLRVIAALLILGASAANAAPVRLKVVAALASFDATGAAVVNASFDPDSARILAELTAASIGRKLEIRVDGEVVSEPVIREPILGGSIVISGSMTAQEAGRLAMRLRDGGVIEAEVASP